MIPLAISNIAWDTAIDLDVAEILRKLEVNCIDIAPGKYFADFASTADDSVLKVRQWWLDRGISIIGMQSLLFGTQGLNLFGSQDVQKKMLDHLAHVCRIGSLLGAKKLVFGSPKNRDREGLQESQTNQIALNFFYQLGEIAKEHGVDICLEPNPPCYGANFLTKTLDTFHFVSKLSHPNIKMQLDTGAFFINEESFSLLGMIRNQIGHIHISEPNLSVLGTEFVDHMTMGARLKEVCPLIPRTIEMLNKNPASSISSIEQAINLAKRYYA